MLSAFRAANRLGAEVPSKVQSVVWPEEHMAAGLFTSMKQHNQAIPKETERAQLPLELGPSSG